MKDNRKTPTYDARFSEIYSEREYTDLLIPFDFYKEFEAETGLVLKRYIQENCQHTNIIKVLEAGFGTGVTTVELLNTDYRVMVTAVDNESKMLEIAKKKFAMNPEFNGRIKLVHADIVEFLESDTGMYDAFASVYTLHNFPHDYRKKVIGLIASRLRPGGIFINGDKYARDEVGHKEDFAAEIGNHDKFDILADKAEKEGDLQNSEYWRRLKKEGIQHAEKDDKIKITVKEQDEMFREFGFKDIEWRKRFDLVTTVSAIKI